MQYLIWLIGGAAVALLLYYVYILMTGDRT
jgi:hypothetical protein